MLRGWPISVFWILLFAGCLQPGPAPAGVHLFHSQSLESPGFLDANTIRFNERVAPATGTKGGVYNLWFTSSDGSQQRKVVANYSDRWGEQDPPGGLEHYFMVDEGLGGSSGTVPVATLLLLNADYQQQLSIDGVSNYRRFTVPIGAIYAGSQDGRTCPGFSQLQDNCPQLFFERPAQSGQAFPTLYLWDGRNQLLLGADSGSFQIQTVGNDAYFILGSKHTLTRLDRPSYALDSLLDNVTGFLVRGDERYAALSFTEDNTAKTVIRDLQTGADLSPAVLNPPRPWGFSGNSFTYCMNATASTPAEQHSLDLETGDEQVTAYPSPLVSCPQGFSRNNSSEVLYLDSLKQGVLFDQSTQEVKGVLKGPLITPSFTRDGAYIIYLAPATTTEYDPSVQGALMFQDADLAHPPVEVSPPGVLVGAPNGHPSYDFMCAEESPCPDPAPLIYYFWGHLGRASADLYFVDYQSGSQSSSPPTNLRLVARSIVSVSISPHSLFGILNLSQQDDVGDLVYRDLDTGIDRLFAQSVSDDAMFHDNTTSIDWDAYIVRGRVDSDRSGLWLTTVMPPETPDGGSN